MFKVFNKITVIIVLVVMAIMLSIPAAAMDFTVKAVLPENQRSNGSTFFDLLVYPGQKQELTLEITNISEKEIVVLVETITASTNLNGEINYSSNEEMDESLKYSFRDMVTIPESYYDIPAQSSIEVPITLTVPDEPFEGVLLGSLRVLREATQDEKDAAGAIVNQYASVTAVRLVQSENAGDIPADFALGEINAELINYRASIVAKIRNTQPVIVKGATATATIYPKGGDQSVFEYSLETLEFAPNSVFPYSFVDREGYGIEAGDYTAVIGIEYKGKNWNFEQDFTIEPQIAQEINENAVNQYGQTRPGTETIDTAAATDGIPLWAVIAIAVGAALMTAVIALMIMITKRKPVKAA